MPSAAGDIKGLSQVFKGAGSGIAAISGIRLPLAVKLAIEAAKKSSRPLLFITASSAEAEEALLNYRTLSHKEGALFSAQNWQHEKELQNISVSLERMECYSGLLEKRLPFIAAPLLGILQDVPDPDKFRRRGLEIAADSEYPPEKLAEDLFNLGYERADMVQFRGEFSSRGGILDIFPLTEENPIRLEYFGDEISTVRSFDLATQRSIGKNRTETVTIYSASEHNVPDSSGESTLLDYYGERPLIVWYEIGRIIKEWEGWCTGEIAHDFLPRGTERLALFRNPREGGHLYISEFASDLPPMDMSNVLHIDEQTFTLQSPEGYSAGRDGLKPFEYVMEAISAQLKSWHAGKWHAIIHCATDSDLQRLEELFTERGVPKGAYELQSGSLSGGWLLPEIKEAVLVDDEIFQRAVKRRRPPKSKLRPSEPIDNLATIKPGTIVVHLDHGIGIYDGIRKIKDGDGFKEMICLTYANNDKLYVSLGQACLVERYISVGGKDPELDSLGGTKWKSRCKKAEKAVYDLASELLERQAKRAAKPGLAALPDNEWQKNFEKSFSFVETTDQIKAIADVKADMEAPKAMDRLVCGDVGFGKTEVALRAAFKAVMSGHQVAVLAPTTILAHQHLETFHERCAHYPIRLGEMSRFIAPKDQKQIAKDLSEGKIDIIIGTHRLLSQDIKIPNLGLIIIDEEQRFGVRHKERLKKFSQLADVLSLSATPIPRTLYQSLTGIRDMSIIMTPPMERLPVITAPIKKSGPVIRDAITREIAREGQVFYLHNRVETIYKEKEDLQKLMPSLRIAVGHGQMPEDELEEIIADFINRKYDLLLCTMIVEAGIDMPNVNTIIIDEAQRFGLADLYQLRGRVGRSTRQAYCYLILPKTLSMDSAARHRLRAIMENTALGSGYQIAMKDLELRGAGNILGAQQSGHIVSIGFGLYCKLLQKAIQMIKSGSYVPPTEEEILEANEQAKAEENFQEEESKAKNKKFDWRKELPSLSPSADQVRLDIPLRGDIPDSYVGSTVLRLDLFRRVSSAKDTKELLDIKEEMADRFGKLPATTLLLLDLAEISVRAKERGIDALENNDGILIIRRQGKIYNPFGRFPKIDYKKQKEAVFAILAFLSRIEPLPLQP